MVREGAATTLMDKVLGYMAGERAKSKGAAAKEAADLAAQSLSLLGKTCLTILSPTMALTERIRHGMHRQIQECILEEKELQSDASSAAL